MNPIEAIALRKNYLPENDGGFVGLGRTEGSEASNITFSVEPGELFGIIGPDGAGKTTLFRILTTLLLADSGTAWVEGFDVVSDFKSIRENIGYMPGRFSLYQDLTVEENLNFFATIFHTTLQANYDLIKDIYQQIEPFKHRKAGQLSGGMKQKLALSCALIHKPKVLFLDEPTTGVDAVSRKEFWDMLGNLKQQGITILVSTPYMDEASLCDRIALIQDGRFLTIDTPTGIVHQFKETLWAIKGENASRLLVDLRKKEGITSCFAFGDSLHVTLNPLLLKRDDLLQSLSENHAGTISVEPITPTIEDCFLQLSSQQNSESWNTSS
jgi:ABC-type multidrug transport system ATPase subunit